MKYQSDLGPVFKNVKIAEYYVVYCKAQSKVYRTASPMVEALKNNITLPSSYQSGPIKRCVVSSSPSSC